MAFTGTTRAVVAALVANAGVAAAKFVGFVLTGSSSLLAEAVHSSADTINELLLIAGKVRARKRPDSLHQFGYGRSRYFYSFVVALTLFMLGATFAFYEGYTKIVNREPVTAPGIAIGILAAAALLETYSLRTARAQSYPLKGTRSWWRFIRDSRTPELLVVLLEDSAALVGLGMAFVGVALTTVTANPFWDGLGSCGIGVLLSAIAVVLIVETHSLLIGEGATRGQYAIIRSGLEQTPHVQRVAELRTQYLGPDELLVTAKIVFGAEVKLVTVADVIADADARARAVVPALRMIYLHPCVERGRGASRLSDPV